MNKIKVATAFSGIGAIEHALKRLNVDHEIEFACDIDKY
jgi:DNA (cytosine-5)-methyltransferase 1